TGTARDALPRPGVQRGDVRLLHALLGQVEITSHPHRRGEHKCPLPTVRLGDRPFNRGVAAFAAGHDAFLHPARAGTTSPVSKSAGWALTNDRVAPMDVTQVRLIVSDFPAMFRFYRDVIGLKPQFDDDRGPYAAFSPDNGSKIALHARSALAEAVADLAPAS